jgi:uncharacterized protein YdeI (YjbR/CyaY-like superfamily)
MEQYDNRLDAYIEKSADFAKPVLTYIRQLVHEASPLIGETIKWGFPFFDYKGPVCMMMGFKKHCAFGFWKAGTLTDPEHVLKLGDEKAGSFGNILTIADLPSKEILINFILQGIERNEKGVKFKVATKKTPEVKAELVTPEYFLEFLSQNLAARNTFDNFSYSHKKEYAEWIVDAKTDATRQKRMETALEWISAGKSRHWKYQK